MRLRTDKISLRAAAYWTVSVADPVALLAVAVIVVVWPVAPMLNVATPVLLPMGMAALLEVHVGVTACPFESVAVNVTEPTDDETVNAPAPSGVHKAHAIVRPFDVWLLTVSVVLAVWFPDFAVMVVLPTPVPAVARPE